MNYCVVNGEDVLWLINSASFGIGLKGAKMVDEMGEEDEARVNYHQGRVIWILR